MENSVDNSNVVILQWRRRRSDGIRTDGIRTNIDTSRNAKVFECRRHPAAQLGARTDRSATPGIVTYPQFRQPRSGAAGFDSLTCFLWGQRAAYPRVMSEKPVKRRVSGGRITAKGTRPEGFHHDTTSHTGHRDLPSSPLWVPILMFGLLFGGVAVIILNYTGSFWDTRNVILLAGLGMILGGIITATQYR